MALVKKDQAAPAASDVKTAPGAFETDETTHSPAAVAAAGVAAGTAIAKAQSTELSTAVTGPIKEVLSELKDVITGVDFGTLPRLTGSNGNVMDSDKKLLGDWVDLTAVSWNEQYVVSPGDDSAEAKAMVRYSRDGKKIDETGEDVATYLESLRNEGYPKSSVKQYTEVIGILEKTAKKSDLVGSMVQISLSPQSRKAFKGYVIQRSVQVKMGRALEAGSEKLRFIAEVKQNGPNSYTQLRAIAQDAVVPA